MILLEAVADGELGGGTTHVLQLIDAVRSALPVEVQLLSQRDAPILAEAASRGVRVHGLEFFRNRASIKLWLEVRRLVARVRPDLIHVHGARAALPLAHAGHSGPLLYTVHGYHFVTKHGLAHRLGLLAEQRIARRATATVFVSAADREIARRHRIRPRSQRLIPNGIETGDLPRARPGDGRTLAFLGRLAEQKDPLLLIDILARLREHGFRLRVIGDGPLRPLMMARAEALGVLDRLELCGAVPRHAALDALRDATVLLLPSRWEGLPLALLEAMAIGVPVVASRISGNLAVVEDGQSGFLVGARDLDEYVRKILALALDPHRRDAVVAAAKRRIEDRFAWSATRLRYLALYREMLKPRGRSGMQEHARRSL